MSEQLKPDTDELIRIAKQQAYQDAIFAVCYFCSHGHEPSKGEVWEHRVAGEVFTCKGSAIRELAQEGQ